MPQGWTERLNPSNTTGTSFPALVHLATRAGTGGVSVFILQAEPERLRAVEECLPALRRRPPMQTGELVYGWLEAPGQTERVDEVLLSAPAPEQRIITGHGGTASALALLELFIGLGFAETAEAPALMPAGAAPDPAAQEAFRPAMPPPADLERLLPRCRTASQAEFVLRAMNGDPAAAARLPDLLRPRRWCLCGAPNAGKSSLLNRLCAQQRVLVSPLAGTTLDAVEHPLDLGGYDCTLVDTAGFRTAAGLTEQEAMRRGQEELKHCDLALCLLDATRPLNEDDRLALAAAAQAPHLLLVLNKCDAPAPAWREENACLPAELRARIPAAPLLRISASPAAGFGGEDGIAALRQAAITAFGGPLRA